jgi:hypothetical protein
MVTPVQSSQEGPSGSLNPYQAPAATAAPLPVRSETDPAPVPLRFWEGRQALLKSLFYMRCFAVVTALVALRTGYLLVRPYVQPQEAFPLGGSPPSLADFWVAACFLFAALLMALTLVFSYVVWQFAKNLQQVASRREANPTQLCRQHLLLWRLKVAMLAAILLQQGVSYVLDRTILSEIESMAKD